MDSTNRKLDFTMNMVWVVMILMLYIKQMYDNSLLKAIEKSWILLIYCLTFLTICIGLFRVQLFSKELFYIHTDYNGNVFSVLDATFNFNVPSWIMIIVTIISFLNLVVNSNFKMKEVMQLNPYAILLAIALSIYLFIIININECQATIVAKHFSKGLNPGAAMACNYFYGYLKIILPSSGGIERAGIKNTLELFEGQENEKIHISVKKLFILIPSSSYIPPDLKDVSNNWLEFVKTLETIVIDRAGVKSRRYHNTLYKFRSNGPDKPGKAYYLATEGATPVKTFFEVINNSNQYSSLYKEYKREIIRSFYITLQNLLNDNPDCKDYCELVYYEDTVDGKPVNPAHILRDRIDKYLKPY